MNDLSKEEQGLSKQATDLATYYIPAADQPTVEIKEINGKKHLVFSLIFHNAEVEHNSENGSKWVFSKLPDEMRSLQRMIRKIVTQGTPLSPAIKLSHGEPFQNNKLPIGTGEYAIPMEAINPGLLEKENNAALYDYWTPSAELLKQFAASVLPDPLPAGDVTIIDGNFIIPVESQRNAQELQALLPKMLREWEGGDRFIPKGSEDNILGRIKNGHDQYSVIFAAKLKIGEKASNCLNPLYKSLEYALKTPAI